MKTDQLFLLAAVFTITSIVVSLSGLVLLIVARRRRRLHRLEFKNEIRHASMMLSKPVLTIVQMEHFQRTFVEARAVLGRDNPELWDHLTDCIRDIDLFLAQTGYFGFWSKTHKTNEEIGVIRRSL
jgi:hypothetical protein